MGSGMRKSVSAQPIAILPPLPSPSHFQQLVPRRSNGWSKSYITAHLRRVQFALAFLASRLPLAKPMPATDSTMAMTALPQQKKLKGRDAMVATPLMEAR